MKTNWTNYFTEQTILLNDHLVRKLTIILRINDINFLTILKQTKWAVHKRSERTKWNKVEHAYLLPLMDFLFQPFNLLCKTLSLTGNWFHLMTSDCLLKLKKTIDRKATFVVNPRNIFHHQSVDRWILYITYNSCLTDSGESGPILYRSQHYNRGALCLVTHLVSYRGSKEYT